METLETLQEKVIKHGPVLARVMKKPARECVRMIVYRWGSLTAGQSESDWARQQIYKQVTDAYPFVTTWLIKILVTMIINWIFSRRSKGLDRVMRRLRREMP